MNIYPRNIRRCRHIKVNGTQCGSPALRDQKYCYFHHEHREKSVRINANRRRTVAALRLPVLEDANSIQVGVMQVLRLLLGGYIEHKKAGLALYALQIASSNLARTSFEVERPTKVVIDRKKVAETPLGMTPWSERGKDHEIEDDEQNRVEEDEARRRFRHLALELTESLQPKTEEEWQKREDLAVLAGFYSYRSYLEHRQKEKEYEQTKAYDAELHADLRERRLRADLGEKGTGLDIQACAQ